MPNVNRVIIAVTANPLYSGFWNYAARIWQDKFGIVPTAIFYGSEPEFEAFKRGAELGEVVHLPRVADVTLNLNRDWACTWGLFYGAAQFADQVCMLTGIDQIPLNRAFLDHIRDIPVTRYIVGLADAYTPPGRQPDAYPSSHHVARGALFRQIFDLEAQWPDEVRKVFALRSRYYLPEDAWGLDEAYSSAVLKGRSDVVFYSAFWTFFHTSRLWRGKDRLATLDFAGIRAGRYSEWHADRPFEANDPALLKQLAESIPVYAP